MASGKTTIGKLLAGELGVSFVDTDDVIVARHGSIAELFAREGEAGFRAAELEAVREVLERPACVIALGGGAVTHEATRALLGGRTLRVYLDVPAETILARLRRSRTVRPVVGARPTLQRVRELFAQREALYRESDLVVAGPRRTKRAFARAIAERLRENS